MLVVISGFSATRFGVPGVYDMADDPEIGGAVPHGATLSPLKSTHTQHTLIIDAIRTVYLNRPCEPTVIIGHSYGADTAVEVCQRLQRLTDLRPEGLCVDLLIQIDSVGIGDEVKPSNVQQGVNIWSTSRIGINGAPHVSGSENIGIDNTTHTRIDDDPRTWNHVKRFIRQLNRFGCNCRLQTGPVLPVPNNLGVTTPSGN